MKLLWYLLVKAYVRLGFAFYFKKFLVVGIDHVPRKKAVLFVANHQNALIDPLLIGSVTPRELHFLTRADVFRRPVIRALLSTVNMMPIYRIRDGINSMGKNEEVFQKCFDILNNKGAILIFPEGSHNIQRRVRPLRKGFTRIVFGALEREPEQEVFVVPIGINFTNAVRYGSSVSLHYGKPILANDYWMDMDAGAAASALMQKVSKEMKKLVTHIEDQERHDAIAACFHEEEFLDPKRVNGKLKTQETLTPLEKKKGPSFNFLMPLVLANSFLPFRIWQYIYPRIEEVEFVATYKFAVGALLFPLFYFLQALLLAWLAGPVTAFVYLVLSFLSVYLLTKSR